MDENRIAALANLAAYNSDFVKEYIDAAPHLKHAELRMFYAQQVIQVFDFARQYTEIPRVLDMGAGEGTATSLFLEMGAHVTAVDLSGDQLDMLRARCAHFGDKLDIRCTDVDSFLETSNDYDIIVANSFLHHIPDYMDLIQNALDRLSPHGQFFSFQDPLRYDSLDLFTLLFSKAAYFSWRIFKGDVVGGMKRYLRRGRGIYMRDSAHDNVEYHVVRNGVDQEAIFSFFKDRGFDCEIIPYFSTHSRLFQPIGRFLGIKNTFAVIARCKLPPI